MMTKKLITFDWVIKCLLPNKASFGIQEGFLSETGSDPFYLEDYQQQPALTPALSLIQLIACDQQQTIAVAQRLTKQRELLGAEVLNFIETVL